VSEIQDTYRSLLHQLPDGYALHQVVLDDSGTPIDYEFLDVNPAFERLTGLQREGLIGRKVTAVLPGIESSGFDWIGTFGRVALGGGTATFEQYSEPLRKWYEVTAYRESPGRFVTLFHDVTPRRLAEDAQFESETRYRALFQLSSEAAYLVTLDGRLLEVNQAWHDLFGYTRDDLSTMTIGTLYANPDQREREFLSRIESDGRMLNWEVRFKKKDGTVMDCICNVVARRDEAGGIMYLQGMVRDVSEEKRQQQALANELNQRRILLEQSRDGIVVLDEGGKVFEANRRFAQMLGYSPEELLQLHVWDWDVPTPTDRLKEMVRTVDESGDHFETQHRRKDGSIYDVEISTNGAIFASRKLIFCVCRDITARKQAEEALHKSEEEYRALFEQSVDAISLASLDGEVLGANPAWFALFGYTPHDLETLRVSATYAEPDGRERFLESIAGKDHLEDELRMKRKDGTPFDCRCRITVRRSSDGTVIGFQTVFHEVTEQRKAERALRESEEKYRSLFEQSMDAIALVGVDGTLIEANPAYWRLFGDDPQDVGRINVTRHYEDPAERDDYVRRMAEHGVVVDDEHRLRRSDGSVMVCLRTSVARRDETGRIVAYQTVLRDITGRRKTERALRQSQERLTLAIENAPIILFDQDRELRYTWLHNANPGVSTDWVLGKLDEELIPAEQAARLTSIKLRVLETGESSREVVETTMGDSLCSYDLTVKPVRDDTGAITGVTCAAVDITERTKSQQQLEASHERLAQVLQGTLEVIQQMTEARDPYTSGHQRRVAALAEAIARKMGLPEDSCVSLVRTSALIHDIGKITVPAEILSKPTPLTDAEFNLVKAHPQLGYDILKQAMLPDPVAEIVRQHHERLDGSGYPQQLTADGILPEAQILAVADVVEAMSSHRPYRAALGVEAALEAIAAGSGKTYDADVVAACLALFREDGFTW